MYRPTIFVRHLFMLELSVTESILSIPVSFIAGVCGGLWGIGAGWVVIPPLMIIGVPAHLAVGSSIVHMAAKSVYPTVKDWKALDWSAHGAGWWIAAPMCIGSVSIVSVGVSLLCLAKAREAAPLIVGVCYCAVLASIICCGLYDHVKRKETTGRVHTLPARAAASLVVGLVTGIMAGLLGAGGGLVRRPALAYFIGTREEETGPISQLAVLVTSLMAIYPHWNASNIHWGLSVLLCAGGIMGQLVGNNWREPLKDSSLEDTIQFTYIVAAGALLLAQILNVMMLPSIAATLLVITATGIAGYSYRIVNRAKAAKGHV